MAQPLHALTCAPCQLPCEALGTRFCSLTEQLDNLKEQLTEEHDREVAVLAEENRRLRTALSQARSGAGVLDLHESAAQATPKEAGASQEHVKRRKAAETKGATEFPPRAFSASLEEHAAVSAEATVTHHCGSCHLAGLCVSQCQSSCSPIALEPAVPVDLFCEVPDDSPSVSRGGPRGGGGDWHPPRRSQASNGERPANPSQQMSQARLLQMSNEELAAVDAASLEQMLKDGLPAQDPTPQVPRFSPMADRRVGPVHCGLQISGANEDMGENTVAQKPRCHPIAGASARRFGVAGWTALPPAPEPGRADELAREPDARTKAVADLSFEHTDVPSEHPDIECSPAKSGDRAPSPHIEDPSAEATLPSRSADISTVATADDQAESSPSEKFVFSPLEDWYGPAVEGRPVSTCRCFERGQRERVLGRMHKFTESRRDGCESFAEQCNKELKEPARPHSWRLIAWNFVGVLLIAYDIIMIPLSVFEMAEPVCASFPMWFARIFWTLDLFARVVLGAFVTGNLDNGLRRVTHRFISDCVPFDFCLVLNDWLFFGVCGAGRSASWLCSAAQFVRVLRFYRLQHLLKGLLKRISSESILLGFTMLRLVLCASIVNHIAACAWYGISRSAEHGRANVDAEVESASLLARYAWSLRWSPFGGFYREDLRNLVSVQESSFAIVAALTAPIATVALLGAVLVVTLQLFQLETHRSLRHDCWIGSYLRERRFG